MIPITGDKIFRTQWQFALEEEIRKLILLWKSTHLRISNIKPVDLEDIKNLLLWRSFSMLCWLAQRIWVCLEDYIFSSLKKLWESIIFKVKKKILICNEYLKLSLTERFWREGGIGKKKKKILYQNYQKWLRRKHMKIKSLWVASHEEKHVWFLVVFWWESLAELQFHNFSILNLAKDAQDSF